MHFHPLPFAACAVLLVAACGEETPSNPLTPDGSGLIDGGLADGADGGVLDAATDASTGPGFDAAPGTGNFAPGDASTGTDGGCDNQLRLFLRDFTEEHDDFESYAGSVKGLVEPDLGDDLKPVYAHPGSTAVTTGPTEYDQWYRDVPGVNMTFEQSITFAEEPPGSGKYVYDNSAFFPLDGMGFGNGPADLVGGILGGLGLGGGEPEHNFLFTTEAHTRFTYQGGEQFTFVGDDDLWIFINGKLAIDLGGVHGAETQVVDLDADAVKLGITVGETYSMDIFHAERHTNESNFRIETTIDLSCIENVDPPDLY